jgi:hypothetical protein
MLHGRIPVIAFVIAMLLIAAPAVAAGSVAQKSLATTVSAPFDIAKSRLTVRVTPATPPVTLSVTDPNLKWKLAAIRPGDLAQIEVDNAEKPTALVRLVDLRRPVPLAIRILALALSAALFLLIAALATGGSPQRFIIGVDNRYSNSQTQIVAWFGTVAIVYLSAVVLRLLYLGPGYIGGVGLPEHLVELTGLSALTFGGAKVITAQKVATAEDSGLRAKAPAARSNFVRDLVTNDSGQADFGDFQMILITLAAIVIFLLSAAHFLGQLAFDEQITLPDVDTTLLSAFGLGQGAYLLKKAALKLGDG